MVESLPNRGYDALVVGINQALMVLIALISLNTINANQTLRTNLSF